MITISHYSVGSVMPVIKLVPKRCDLLLSGSSDVGMRFVELMERRLEGTIRELGVEADEVIAQLDKVRGKNIPFQLFHTNWFLDESYFYRQGIITLAKGMGHS